MPTSTTALSLELEDLRDEKVKAEAQLEKAERGRTTSIVGLLIGIVLFFIIGSWLGGIIGGFLTLAGLLGTITQSMKVSSASSKVAEIGEQIHQKRRQLIEAEEVSD